MRLAELDGIADTTQFKYGSTEKMTKARQIEAYKSVSPREKNISSSPLKKQLITDRSPKKMVSPRVFVPVRKLTEKKRSISRSSYKSN